MEALLLGNERPASTVDHEPASIALVPEMPVPEALMLIMAECRRGPPITCDSAAPQGGPGSVWQRGRRSAWTRECGPARELHAFLSETAPDVPAEVALVGHKLVGRRLLRAVGHFEVRLSPGSTRMATK